jgi:hypothetical protein
MRDKYVGFGDSLTSGWINQGSSFHPYTNRLQQHFSENPKLGYEKLNLKKKKKLYIYKAEENLKLITAKNTIQ